MDPNYRSKLCRICFKPKDTLMDIFGNNGGAELIKSAFASVLQDNVSRTDLFPQCVCHVCVEVLLSFKFFKDNFVRDREEFEAHLGNTVWVHGGADSSVSADEPQKATLYVDVESEAGKKKLKDIGLTPDDIGELSRPSEEKATSVTKKSEVDISTPGCSSQMDMESMEDVGAQGVNEETMSRKEGDIPKRIDDLIEANSNLLNSGDDDDGENTEMDDASYSSSFDSESEEEKEKSSKPVIMKPYVSSNGLFMCKFCDKGFKYKNLLKNHLKEHDDLKPYKCPYCEKRYMTLIQLNYHIVIHSDYKPYECETCGVRMRTKGRLVEHKRCHSVTTETYLCWHCGNTYGSRLKLNRHIFRCHHDVKPYCCLQCNMEFKSPAKFKIHQNRHDGIKPYMCQICNKHFVGNNRLKEHMVAVHTKEKPVICDICDKRFALRRYMLLHMKTVHFKSGDAPVKRYRKKTVP